MKFIRTAILFAAICSLTACGFGGGGGNDSPDNSPPVVQPPPEPPPPVEPPLPQPNSTFILDTKGALSPWSADSSHIAFVAQGLEHEEGGDQSLFLAPVSPPADTPPAERFDDVDIVFISNLHVPDTLELYTYSLADGSTTRLSAPLIAGGNVTRFRVSPAGVYIAYIADQDSDESYELYVVAANGHVSRVGGPVAQDASIYWAPNGSAITYLTQEGRRLNVTSPDAAFHLSLGIDQLRASNTSMSPGQLAAIPVEPATNTSAAIIREYQWSSDSRFIALMLDPVVDPEQPFDPFLEWSDIRIYDRSGRFVRGSEDGFTHNFALFEQSYYSSITGSSFRWSPDSTRIATTWGPWSPGMGGPASNMSIFTVDEATAINAVKNFQQNSGGEQVGALSWSPDSTRIAFINSSRYSPLSGRSLLFSMRPDTSEPVPLALASHCSDCYLSAGNFTTEASSKIGTAPAWSPSGEWIAYVDLGERAVYVVDPGGVNDIRVSNPPIQTDAQVVFGISPGQLNRAGTAFDVWSPDSEYLLYLSNYLTKETYNLFVARADGSGAHTIGAITSDDVNLLAGLSAYAKWSPDGSLIAFLSQQGGRFQLNLSSPFATQQRVIADNIDPENFAWMK